MMKNATFDPTGTYRYTLRRHWGPDLSWALWVMLNPSTADADLDDPTIRRCMGFTRREGLAGMDVVNLFALRSTRPVHLLEHDDPVGPANAEIIASMIDAKPSKVIFAWGAWDGLRRLHRPEVEAMCLANGIQPVCLGTTQAGHPRHPLYVKGTQPFIPWSPAR